MDGLPLTAIAPVLARGSRGDLLKPEGKAGGYRHFFMICHRVCDY
nr:hypothetical protein JVH1_9085 [Rhodococcus sp. JVH1]